jgi:hypothetical protein
MPEPLLQVTFPFKILDFIISMALPFSLYFHLVLLNILWPPGILIVFLFTGFESTKRMVIPSLMHLWMMFYFANLWLILKIGILFV